MRPNSEMPVALIVTSVLDLPSPTSALIASVSVGLRTITTSDAVASGVVEPPLESQPHTSQEPAVENVVLNVLVNAPFCD